MLKHEDIPQAQPSSAAQVRVTPEELAAAVTALQIRKEGQPGTITIGDAVEELGLDATPEEVLAEVQVLRAPKPKQSRLGITTPYSKPVLIALAFTVSFGLILRSGLNAESDYAYQNTPRSMSTAPDITVEDKQESGINLLALDQVSDDQPVRVMLGDLFFFTSFKSDRGSWLLIKHNGELYVRGFVDPNQSPLGTANKYGGSTTIYNSRDWHPDAVPVTLELNSFKCIPGNGIHDDGNQVAFDVTDVHPNRYENEKW